MKLLLFLLTALSLCAQQSFVNSTSVSNGSTSSSTAVLPALNVSAGNLLAVFPFNNTTSVSSVSDTGGDTFQACPNNASGAAIEFWYAFNVKGNASDVITVTYNTAAAFLSAGASQYKGGGIAETGQVGNTASGSSVTSASFSPAQAGNLQVAVASCNGGTNCTGGANTWTAGSGYTLRFAWLNHQQTEDEFNAASGAQTATFSVNTSGSTLTMLVCSFKPVSNNRLPLLGVSWLRFPMLAPWMIQKGR